MPTQLRAVAFLFRVALWCLALAVVLLCALPDFSQAQNEEQPVPDRWQTSLAMGSSTGQYGTASPTTVLYVPWTIRRLFDRGDISLAVPFVSITGDCSVTLLNGVPNATGGTCRSRTISLLNGRIQRTFTLPQTVTNQGLGDVVLQGRYYVLEEQQWMPDVAVTARVKFPTANPDVGLGTGEFDEGVGLELTKEVFRDVLLLGTAGFTITGKPNTVSLRNQWNYNVGVGYSFTDRLLATVYYEEWRALISGFQNPRDVLMGLNYRLPSGLSLSGSVLIGLSDGAPDWGLTGGVSMRF